MVIYLKIFKNFPFLLIATNTLGNSTIISPEITNINSNNFIEPRTNMVGFRGDDSTNKRAIVWSGDDI